jgi:protease I
MAEILVPIPSRDFDPTEAAVPWRALRRHGHRVLFATPDGKPGEADARTLSGNGLGPFARMLRADDAGRAAYAGLSGSAEFQRPLRYEELRADEFDGLLLPGGHAPGMKAYLESPLLQALAAAFFAQGKPVGAICHGVVLAARSRAASGRSVLHGRKTTALTRQLEMAAWHMTMLFVGRHYRTYPVTVEAEVRGALAAPTDFLAGPRPGARDSEEQPNGFAVVDGNYVSARYPGDVHRFASELLSAIDRAAGGRVRAAS